MRKNQLKIIGIKRVNRIKSKFALLEGHFYIIIKTHRKLSTTLKNLYKRRNDEIFTYTI